MLEKRRKVLTDAIAKVEYPVLHSTAFDAKPADLIHAAKGAGAGGIVAKRKGSLYALSLGVRPDERRDGKLPVAQASACGPDRVHGVDA
jgi:hypothetical protein